MTWPSRLRRIFKPRHIALFLAGLLAAGGVVYARVAFLCRDALERGERAAAAGDVPLSIAWFGRAAAFSLPLLPWDEEAADHLADLAGRNDLSPVHARMAALALAAARKTPLPGTAILGPQRPALAVLSSFLFLVFLASMTGLIFGGFSAGLELRPAPARFWGSLSILAFFLWAVTVHAA